MKKKRQATDSTMRNVRAANKRIKRLEDFRVWLSEEVYVDEKGYFRAWQFSGEKKRRKK